MNNKLLQDYSDALMANPFVQYADGIMGTWFDFYMNIWLQLYYWPSFVAGKEDEWSRNIRDMLSGSSICK
jgi:hypothetical protein